MALDDLARVLDRLQVWNCLAQQDLRSLDLCCTHFERTKCMIFKALHEYTYFDPLTHFVRGPCGSFGHDSLTRT